MVGALGRKPRREARVQTNFPVTLLVKSEVEDKVQPVIATNVSEHGLQIRTHFGLVPGLLVYAFSRGRGTQFGACRVVWVRALLPARGIQAGLEVLR